MIDRSCIFIYQTGQIDSIQAKLVESNHNFLCQIRILMTTAVVVNQGMWPVQVVRCSHINLWSSPTSPNLILPSTTKALLLACTSNWPNWSATWKASCGTLRFSSTSTWVITKTRLDLTSRNSSITSQTIQIFTTSNNLSYITMRKIHKSIKM